MERLSRIWFGLLGAALMVMATILAVYGLRQAVVVVLTDVSQTAGDALLSSVGYLVIATAIFEVGKYIIEEEVIRERELRYVSEVRRSLTRFISTVIIIVLLEGLVGVFKAANKDASQMPYPTLLLITGILMLVGLGAFQRMAASVERDIGGNDDRAAEAEREEPGLSASGEDMSGAARDEKGPSTRAEKVEGPERHPSRIRG